MSMNEFKEAMKNEAMRQEFTAFIEEKKPDTPEALAEVVTEFAAARGFTISKEDVVNNIPDKLKSGKMELSDDVMDNVVGGGWLQDWCHEIAVDFVNMLEELC